MWNMDAFGGSRWVDWKIDVVNSYMRSLKQDSNFVDLKWWGSGDDGEFGEWDTQTPSAQIVQSARRRPRQVPQGYALREGYWWLQSLPHAKVVVKWFSLFWWSSCCLAISLLIVIEMLLRMITMWSGNNPSWQSNKTQNHDHFCLTIPSWCLPKLWADSVCFDVLFW